MSLLGKKFQKQKNNNYSTANLLDHHQCIPTKLKKIKHLQQITQGINRIRFIQNRVTDHPNSNVILQLFSNCCPNANKCDLQTDKNQQEQKNFTINFNTNSYSNSLFVKRPISQLRDLSQSKYRYAKQNNLQKAQKLKQQKIQLKKILTKRNEQNILEKMIIKRRVLKQKQFSKSKKQAFLDNRNKLIKLYKQKKQKQLQRIRSRVMLEKLSNGRIKNQQLLQQYQQSLILAQKIKQIIIQNYQTQEQIKQNQQYQQQDACRKLSQLEKEQQQMAAKQQKRSLKTKKIL